MASPLALADPHYLEERFKAARTTHLVVLALCGALLAAGASDDKSFDQALRELDALESVDWAAYDDEEVWPAVETAIDERRYPTVHAGLARVQRALTEAVRAAGGVWSPENSPAGLVLYDSLAPPWAETVADYYYGLNWPEVWFHYPDPSFDIERVAREQIGLEGFPPGTPVRVEAYRVFTTEERGGTDWISLRFHVGEGEQSRPLHLFVDVPALAVEPWETAPVRAWLVGRESERERGEVLFPREGESLVGLQRHWADVHADRPFLAVRKLRRLREASQSEFSLFGIPFPARFAATLGAGVLLGAMFLLLVQVRGIEAACADAKVPPGRLPVALFSRDPYAVAWVFLTLYVLPSVSYLVLLTTEGFLLWTCWLPLKAAGAVGILGASYALARVLGRARLPQEAPESKGGPAEGDR